MGQFENSAPTSIFALFAAWKALLLLLAVCSPGPGYDTSTSLLLGGGDAQSFPQALPSLASVRLPALGKLVRWDAIYFVQIASRGYRFEQEWAFGPGFPKTVATVIQVLAKLGLERAHASPLGVALLVAVLLANAAHLLSALVLYHLTRTIFPGAAGRRVALLSAFLHILSPAGLFLSAPYAESLFSCLSFLGQLLYAKSMLAHAERHALRQDALVVGSGILFGLATFARSNGLFNGIFFLYDAAKTAMLLWSRPCLSTAQSLLAYCVGGAFVGLGMLVPQILAYASFCLEEQSPSRWCARRVPSIYLWVQQHYWNVGFLRYWTISNIPLFLIATPMLWTLGASAVWALRTRSMQTEGSRRSGALHASVGKAFSEAGRIRQPQKDVAVAFLYRAALPQALLTLLAVTNYHVQIINRLCSGYTVWYWWLAFSVIDDTSPQPRGRGMPCLTVKWMIAYALIQAGLFASFLPPA